MLVVACSNESQPAKTFDDAPALTGAKYSLPWGPVTIPGSQDPGREGTKCIDVRLTNPTEIKVHQIHNTLFPGSHHLIVYRNDQDTVERLMPYDCKPFTGALNASGMVAPMMITQRSDDALTLPDTVGYTLKPNQMIRLEMHYFNTADTPIEGMATVDFFEGAPGTITQEANLLFIGTPDINIAPNEVKSVHQYFTPSRAPLDLTEAKFFAITGHTHKLGTQVTVKTGPKGGPLTTVYDPRPFDWSEPVTTGSNPEFSIPAGTGFDFQCDYHNTTATAATFGESATDEMCFFWAYYYPSKGAFVCVHCQSTLAPASIRRSRRSSAAANGSSASLRPCDIAIGRSCRRGKRGAHTSSARNVVDHRTRPPIGRSRWSARSSATIEPCEKPPSTSLPSAIL
ncbi:MAG: hypothetical protein NT062_33920 [Proteobacteria bacterium]|nr:hypothetical protein [Pseudomonadota bacterium]